MQDISLVVAFSAGLLSFLSPCVLPLVPVYVASLYGPEIFESTVNRRMPIFLHSLSFVIGFSLVFILLGIGAGLAGLALGLHLDLIRKISGILLLAFGVFMLVSLKVPQLNVEKRMSASGNAKGGYLRSALTGGVFSLAWTPCVGPILGSILTLAWGSETVWQGGYLLAIYSLGLGLPFLILGAAFDSISPVLRKLNRHSRTISIISAALLIVVGILILANKLSWLQGL